MSTDNPDQGPDHNISDLKNNSRFRKRRKGPYTWWSKLAFNTEGAVKPILHNVITILREHPDWVGLFSYDSFANRISITRKTVYGREPGELTDLDGAEVVAWLGNPDQPFLISPKTTLVLEAIAVVARCFERHPVREYLGFLRWDGEERLPTLLSHYFGADQNDYTQAVSTNWLISAVARVMRPGIKVDFMVVLEGNQGIGKSRSIRDLFGAPWFAEAMESPANKDFYQTLQGRWCVEISEMHSFSKGDVTKVKQAITTQDDVYRPSYGRHAQRFPRHNIFVGSTNDEDYLRDPTGARRFLPVKCKEIEYDALIRDRNQLWAEAYYKHQRGDPYWILPAQAAEEQDSRYQEDSWTEPIVRWIEGEADAAAYGDDQVGRIKHTTITQLMSRALKMELAKHTRQDQMRVGAILRRLGWRRQQKRNAARREYVFERPPD